MTNLLEKVIWKFLEIFFLYNVNNNFQRINKHKDEVQHKSSQFLTKYSTR